MLPAANHMRIYLQNMWNTQHPTSEYLFHAMTIFQWLRRILPRAAARHAAIPTFLIGHIPLSLHPSHVNTEQLTFSSFDDWRVTLKNGSKRCINKSKRICIRKLQIVLLIERKSDNWEFSTPYSSTQLASNHEFEINQNRRGNCSQSLLQIIIIISLGFVSASGDTNRCFAKKKTTED